MPMIVYKTLDLSVHYVQARRVLCEYCRQPFTYVLGEKKTFNVTGVPIVSSDEGMRGQAMKKAANALAQIARAKNKGEAMCPHCKRYQGFMVSRSRFTGLGCGFFGGLGVMGCLAILAGIWFSLGSEVILGLTVAGAVVGLVIGKTASLDAGPHRDKEDQRAIRDDEVPELLARCEQDDYEPILFWYLALGNKTDENDALVSLGVYDTSGRPPVFPRELASDFVVRQLQAGAES